MPGLLELLLSGGNPQLRLGGEDTPAGGGLLDALGQRIMQQQYNPQMGGAAPLNVQAAQPAQQAVEAPQRAMAAPQVSMPQQGCGGLLGALFGGRGGSRGQSYNGTVNWLTGKGYSPEAASLIASNKDMLGKVIISSGSPGEATAFQQRAQALVQAGIDPNSAEGKRYFLTGNLDQGGPQPTDDMREYQQAVQQGYKGSFVDYMKELKRAGANINNGTIPTGYQAVYGPNQELLRYDPVPGGPADQERQAAAATAGAKEDSKAVSTEIITNAANIIRQQSQSVGATGLGGAILSNLPTTPAAEIYRQIDVLKSNASIENLQAMRAASPTGGALGSVTEKENAMLAAKSGALDPKSPRFQEQLDDYERTLLQIVHGKAAGDAIFQQTRNGGSPQPAPQQSGGRKTKLGVTWSAD